MVGADTASASRQRTAPAPSPRAAARSALRAAAGGLAGLVAAGAAGGVALVAVVPADVAAPVALRTPFWLMGAALGGRLRIDGPIAGRISALNDGGLLGPPRGQAGAGLVEIAAMPLTLTAVALGVTYRMLSRAPAPRPGRPAVVSVAAGAGCYAIAAALLCLATRLSLPAAPSGGSGTVALGLTRCVLTSALLGAATAALAVLRPAGALHSAVLTEALRLVRRLGAWVVAVGVPAVVVLALVALPGVASALLTGGPAPVGVRLILAVLLAPVVAWTLLGLGLGVPVAEHGAVAGLQRSGTWTVADLVHATPAGAVLPVAALALLAVAAAVPSTCPVRTRVPAGAAAFAALGVAGSLLVHVGIQRAGVQQVTETAVAAPVWWLALIVLGGWGAVAAWLGPVLAAQLPSRVEA